VCAAIRGTAPPTDCSRSLRRHWRSANDPEQTLSVQVSSRLRQAQVAANGELSRAAVCVHPTRTMRRVTAQTRSRRVSSDSLLPAFQWRILESQAMPSGCRPQTDRHGQQALLTGPYVQTG
jgi:hypothetical protein